jgi:hypothetical protein
MPALSTRLDVLCGATLPFLHSILAPNVGPAGISHAVACLVSDESRYATGQRRFVDDGAVPKSGI